MIIIGSLLLTVVDIINTLLGLYKWIVIIAALITWVNPDPYNPIVRFLRAVTEPIFRPIRRMIGYRLGPVDISPLIVVLCIMFIQTFLSRLITAYQIKGGAVL